MNIRLECEEDYFEVENLTREAFWNVYRPGCFEHVVLHNLRNDKCFVKELDYVICEAQKIVGNIVYALANIKKDNGEIIKTLIFGPVSIIPSYQHKGYGEALINYTLDKAKSMGYPAVIITGNPSYYKKYGFECASKYNIFYEGLSHEEESPFFMIKVFDKEKVRELSGEYSDPNVYNIDNKELDEFDKLFPKKIKMKKEGQLE